MRRERENQQTRLPERMQKDMSLQFSFNRLINGALASSTNDKYVRPWLKFREWLAQYDITEPLTIDAQIVAFYVVHLITSAELRCIGDALVLTALASIAHHFSLAGLAPPTNSPHLTLLRRAAKRTLQPLRSLCEPISSVDLYIVLVKFLTPTCDLRDRMHLTCFLLMFLGLFRFSDIQSILVHKDLFQFIRKSESDPTIDGMLIFIPCSKTDQYWLGAWVAVGATGGVFCPVRLVMDLFRLGGYVVDSSTVDVGPLLRATQLRHHPQRYVLKQRTAPLSAPIQPLSYAAYRQNVQSLVFRATAKHVGMHAARSGGASLAAELNIDSRLVCGLGRWKLGNTFADIYIRMMDGNMRKYFQLTRTLWPH